MTSLRSLSIIVLLGFGCAHPVDTSAISPELQPPQSAKRIEHEAVKGYERVSYVVPTAHPASDFIERMAAEAARRGWRPLAESYFNPGTRSSYVEGWKKYVAGGLQNDPKRNVYRWWAQWLKPDGSILDLTLLYEYGLNERAKLDSLYVGASIMSQEVAKGMGISPPSNPVFVSQGTQPNTADVVENLLP
jgi:hypothetical protein